MSIKPQMFDSKLIDVFRVEIYTTILRRIKQKLNQLQMCMLQTEIVEKTKDLQKVVVLA